MKSRINRRDFLKLGGLLPLAAAAPRLAKTLARSPATLQGQKNVIVLVFDAFSAYNISLYGYQRKTTPNLARLADRAIIYHNHFAGSNFTTSGTASLLTGTYPWTHRALQADTGVADRFVTRNLFGVFQDHYRTAYTHNSWAYTLLRQFRHEIEGLVPPARLFLASYDGFLETLFSNDDDIATVSWARNVSLEDGYAYSLFLSHLYNALREGKISDLQPFFPRGMPSNDAGNVFLLEQAVDWLAGLISTLPQPFLGYFHFYPPHAPYRTSREFYNYFSKDRYRPLNKPLDEFAEPVLPPQLGPRRSYDEYILYADKEFGRFYDSLEKNGLLENTWLILTSDHGELFERGIVGHGTAVLYQPLVRVPLLIFEPGREAGMDIHTLTSAVDLVPTLAHVTGYAIPDWAEGVLLPPYAAASPDPNRSVYALQARENQNDAPIKQAATMLVKGRYKLLYYFGYRELGVSELVKLYDLEADPDELVDLYSSRKDIAAELLGDLKAKLKEVNQPYL